MEDPFWGQTAYSDLNEEDPTEDFFDDLTERHGSDWVQFTTRLFHLRRWKEVHGNYPYPLNYLMLRGLLAVDQEVELRRSYEMYKTTEEHKREMEIAKAKQRNAQPYRSNLGKPNTF